ncbi:hypothetical protein QBC43DRAFT_326670 [Cladorrhinum sp. PSN259]|nr:hypothetical protein QBC43DRAFT_326670 [Cladorrhinum sp. PSN259]
MSRTMAVDLIAVCWLCLAFTIRMLQCAGIFYDCQAAIYYPVSLAQVQLEISTYLLYLTPSRERGRADPTNKNQY